MADQDFVIISHADAQSQPTEEELQALLAWLGPTDYSGEGSEYQKHVHAHVAHTGNWLFETKQYADWTRSNDCGILWIKGVPGSGKSVLASNLVRTLCEQHQEIPVLYFFFRNIIRSNSRPIFMLRDLLAQLLPFSSQLSASLARLMSKYPTVENTPISDLRDTLITSLSIVPGAFVVVDALDEVEASEEAFATKFLLDLSTLKPSSIKIVVTSRPLPVYDTLPEASRILILRLLGKVVDQDIATYITHRLENQSQRDINHEEKSSIHAYLCNGDQPGLFLQARLLLDELIQSNEPIEKSLAQPLQSMAQMYQDILRGISSRTGVSQDLQVHVLEWIIHAPRPVRLLELAELFLSQGVFIDIQTAKSMLKVCCGPLLEVLENETLSIIHHSFTEFLVDSNRIAFGNEKLFPVLNASAVHGKLTSEIINYLLYTLSLYDTRNERSWVDQERMKRHRLQHPFLQYAVEYWPHHFSKGMVRQGEGSNLQLYQKLDLLLDKQGSAFDALLRFSAVDRRDTTLGSECIHLAAHLGLKEYVEYLLQSGINPDTRCPYDRTPIIFAASQGHSELITLIATYGGNIEATDILGLTALHHAAFKNQGAAVEALIACGANLMCMKTNEMMSKTINYGCYDPFPARGYQRQIDSWGKAVGQQSIQGCTPIQFACEYGASCTVIILIRHLNRDQRATISLHSVVQKGHAEVLSTLLQYPEVLVKIDEIDCNGNTPLILASRDINPEVVGLLLKAGASILPVPRGDKEQNSYITLGQKRRRVETNVGMSPLDAWSELFRDMNPRNEATLLVNMEEVADMLVHAGCDVNARSSDGHTLLSRWSNHFSSAAITKKYVFILVQHGADPNAKSQNGSMPLHYMRGRSEEHEAILILLEAGAKINAVRESDGRTPVLNMAFSTHDVPNISPFIKYGVDFSVQDKEGNSVLHFIMRKSKSTYPMDGWLDVCDVRVKNHLGQSCLFALVHRWPGWGLEKIIKQAVERGVDLETRSLNGRTALMEACCEGGNEHIQAFLEAGANPKAIDLDGRSCLHYVLSAQPSNLSGRSRAFEEFEKIIRQLISAGADATATDYAGNHLIHASIWGRKWSMGRLDVADPIKTAVKFGGDVGARNHAGQNALHLAASRRLDLDLQRQNFDATRIEYLLNIGIPHSEQDINGATPVHLAAASSEAMLWKLILAGANLKIRDFKDRTALHYAAENLSNTTGILCEIYRKNLWTVDEMDMNGRTPLHEAASKGNYEGVMYLLESGADPSHIDQLQKAPLHCAAAFQRLEHVESLERGFYSRNRDSSSSERTQVFLGDSRKLLRPLGLWADAEVDQCTAHDAVLALLEWKADPSLIDYLGRTAYDIAVLNGNGNVADILAPLTLRSVASSALIGHYPDILAQKWLASSSRDMTNIIKSVSYNQGSNNRFLESAVYLGNSTLLESLLAAGCDPRESREADDDFTIVHAVVMAGQISMMKSFAKYIGDINTFNPPLLHSAVEREGSNINMVKLLLELGADPNNLLHRPEDMRSMNRKPHYGKFPLIDKSHTVLHRLSAGYCWWYPHAISAIVKKGVDLELTNSEGMTALHLAISLKEHGFWRDQCIDVLLSSGADVNKVYDKEHLTPLNMALEGGCGIEIVQKLLKYGADIGAGPNPPIVSAIKGADLKGTKLLLDAGADPNGLYGEDDRLPLQIAADAFTEDYMNCEEGPEGLEDVITLLLESGANPLADVESDELGSTKIFHYFCTKNAPITPFINFGVDIEARDSCDRTPLHAACSYYGYIGQGGMIWVAGELISNGAEVDVVDSSQNTPLQCTMQTNSDLTEIFGDLIANGASVNIPNSEGRTVLYYVIKHSEHDTDCIYYLLETLMEKGASPNIGTDDDGSSNLHLLASILAGCVQFEGDDSGGNFEAYENLYWQFVDLGCDPEARDDAGETPAFHFVKRSIYEQRPGILNAVHWKRYLEKCDVQAVNEDGDNLLHAVARREENRQSDDNTDAERLFKLLIDMGVDPRKENKAGVSPLDVAATCGKTGILEMFERESQ